MSIVLYTGQKLLKEENNDGKKRPDPYIPSPELVKAVKFAQISKRPLLVKGEPGCGKSSLAEAVAYELFEGKADYNNYFFKWYVKSSSKAQEGLYQINHLERLQQANTREGDGRKSTDIILKTNKDKGEYIELGALGKAFQVTNTMPGDFPAPVVLIDEIDKADIDFPNDLLLELDKMEFTISEAKNENGDSVTIRANRDKKPLIIITSNDEKQLPPAFLRRCLFFYIDFPGPEMLYKIIAARDMKGIQGAELRAASTLFSALRYAIESQGTTTKNITTSELLDWITLINFYYKENDPLFDIDKENTVADFIHKYSAALAKDDASRLMLEDKNKTGAVLKSIIEKYKEYIKEGVKAS